MIGYKEDRLRAIRFRISMVALACALGGGIWVVGPGLERLLDTAREHKTENWAAVRIWRVAKFMEWTFREHRAQELHEEFYLLYSGNEDLVDFSEVTQAEEQMYYLPWVANRYDPDTRPRPKRIGEKSHPLFPLVLAAHGKYCERTKRYDRARHIFRCLGNTFEPGSEAHQEYVDFTVRDALRRF
jgi:hypothetical protein